MSISEFKLLAAVKEQDITGTPRRLYHVFNSVAEDQSPYQWEYSSGMGGYAFHPVQPEESTTIPDLIEKGRLVLGIPESHLLHGVDSIRQLHHFDDAQFGLDENNKFVLYKFNHPDKIMELGEEHIPALKLLQARLENDDFAMVDPRRIAIAKDRHINPILTNRNEIQRCKRQLKLG